MLAGDAREEGVEVESDDAVGKPRERFARLRDSASQLMAASSPIDIACSGPRGSVSHDCRRRTRSGPCPRRSIGEFCPASSVAR